MTRVLIVDDDPVELRRMADLAAAAGYAALTASGGEQALAILRADADIAAVILDLVMPDRDGMAAMESMARSGIAIPVIVAAGATASETIASAIRQGAVDFLTKPASLERLSVSLRNALQRADLESVVRSQHARRAGTLTLNDLITRSAAMHRVLELIRRAAKSTLPVLIEGETGTGKTLVARIIHALSPRIAKPFVALDCTAIPFARIEAALFAPATGALARADGGTLLLRGLGELAPDLQHRLLHFLDTGDLAANSGTRPHRVDVRLIVASRNRLLGLAQRGVLREDLFYQLNVLSLYLPPLRDRREDIASLAAHVIARATAELGRPPVTLGPEALTLLNAYDWPANIRQLETTLHRAIALCESDQLVPADFPQIVERLYGRDEAAQQVATKPLPSGPIHVDAATHQPRYIPQEQSPDRFIGVDGELAPLADLERALIAFALARHAGHMSRVARALGIGRSTLYRKLREYGLGEEAPSRAA
jgi:DNA-binding NtrC family response regulator